MPGKHIYCNCGYDRLYRMSHFDVRVGGLFGVLSGAYEPTDFPAIWTTQWPAISAAIVTAVYAADIGSYHASKRSTVW
jgi:hypothetical protein